MKKQTIIKGGVIALGVLLAISAWLIFYDTRMTTPTDVVMQSDRVPISGIVLDPVTAESVAAVTLTAGDTTVAVGAAGQFRFGDVSLSEGIVLSHPDLVTSITIQPKVAPPEGLIIWFDPGLYQALFELLNITDSDQTIQVTDVVLHQRLALEMAGVTEVIAPAIAIETDHLNRIHTYYFTPEKTDTGVVWEFVYVATGTGR
ncbi:MAG: hypothetical protein AAGA35_02185 [Patescibacteria group bacterium]